MTYFKKRKLRKELKETLHHAKHIRHMHEDIAAPELLEQLRVAVEAAKEARKNGEGADLEKAGNAIGVICDKIAPIRPHVKMRENVEVLFVAIAAAMAIRAYFFQPFKIPTGSMQPTLYGITVRQAEEGEASHLPARIAKFFWKGEVYLDKDTPFDRLAKLIAVGKQYNLRAKSSGFMQLQVNESGGAQLYTDNFSHSKYLVALIGGTPHNIPASQELFPMLRFGESIRKGEPLVKGVAKAGDYILVNRMKYNFMRPKRGDIVVFDAKKVTRDAYYIKRMVGLPGETISVAPPYLLVNGEKPTDPRFEKLFTNPDYHGYQFGDVRSSMPPKIKEAGDSIVLEDDQYLFFGDNTDNSLDGRYFGGVNEKMLLGSAFFVGLPFDRAGFAETVH